MIWFWKAYLPPQVSQSIIVAGDPCHAPIFWYYSVRAAGSAIPYPIDLNIRLISFSAPVHSRQGEIKCINFSGKCWQI